MASATHARSPGAADRFDYIQILGPFNSGTCLVFNYQKALFQVRCSYHTWVWKHSLPPRWQRHGNHLREDVGPGDPDWERTLFLCMVRMPYFWILSMLRRRYGVAIRVGAGAGLDAKIRAPVRFDRRHYSNFAALWNAYYRACRDHLEPRGALHFLRLEDLVQTPADALARLGERLPGRPDADLAAAIAEISNRPAKQHGGDCVYGEEARREYVPERVPRWFEAEDLAFLNRQLDPELMAFFGYPFVW